MDSTALELVASHPADLFACVVNPYWRRSDAFTAALYTLKPDGRVSTNDGGNVVTVQDVPHTLPTGMTCTVLPTTRQVLLRVRARHCFYTANLAFWTPPWLAALQAHATEQWYAGIWFTREENARWTAVGMEGDLDECLLFYRDESKWPVMALHDYVQQPHRGWARVTIPQHWHSMRFTLNGLPRVAPHAPPSTLRALWPRGMPILLDASCLRNVSISLSWTYMPYVPSLLELAADALCTTSEAGPLSPERAITNALAHHPVHGDARAAVVALGVRLCHDAAQRKVRRAMVTAGPLPGRSITVSPYE